MLVAQLLLCLETSINFGSPMRAFAFPISSFEAQSDAKMGCFLVIFACCRRRRGVILVEQSGRFFHFYNRL